MKYPFRALILGTILLAFSNPAVAQSHFNQCASGTGSNASVIIDPAISPTIDGTGMGSGDEIAVFNAAGLCAGVDTWTGSVIAVTVWGDDPFTTPVDGMAANENLRFVMWDQSAGTEVGLSSGTNVNVSYDATPPYRANGSYVADAIYKLASLTGTGVPPNNAPNASFVANPSSGTSPLVVSFNGSASSDSDGNIASYSWSFGDGTNGAGVSPQHTYNSPGTFTASLTVTDNNGATGTASTTITVTEPNNNAPVASIQASPLSGVAPVTVSFNGTGSTDSDGSIQTYAWNFGDGATATGSSIQHLYSSAGTYTARLTVTDDDGASGTSTVQVSVAEPNQPPIALFAAEPVTGVAPLPVTLNANASSDPDGTISTYSWNFGDGTNGTGKNTAHTYDSPGTYTLSLTVVDNDGASSSTTRTVTVTGAGNNAPVAAIQANPSSGTVPLTVAFTGSGSSDSDGSIASYAWSFGDGSTGTGVSPQHLYTSVGTFTASLTVTDDDGAVGSATTQVVVSAAQNVAPTAQFIASPTSGTGPLLVQLNANQSADSDGTIVSYSWSFGDGTNGSGKNVAHTYVAAGTYTLQLTVTDNDGASDSEATTITVVEGVNEQPAANFVATPLSGSAPLIVSADASGSSDSDGTVVSFVWSYGDGTNGNGQTVDHTYSSAGTYSLELVVTDDDGAVSSSSTTITVTGGGNQSPNAIFAASPVSGNAPLLVTVNANPSNDPDGSIVSYVWDYGDGISGSGKNAAHTYLTPGTFTLKLTITDNDGQIATASRTVNVNSAANASPVASFSVSRRSGTAPLLVFFDAGASTDPDGSISSYTWTYGNGVNGSGVTPAHTFRDPGNFTVTLTVTDDQGGVATSQEVIQVTSDIGAQPDLVLRLSLDSASGTSLNDESGKGQQAALMNGAQYEESAGIEGGAVRFDGIDDVISVADNSSLNLSDVTVRTVSAWFRVDDRFVSDRKQVIYEQGGTTRGLSMYVHNGSLYVGGWNDITNESNWSGTFLETGSIQSNVWHHVALTLDGATTSLQDNRFKAYLDGAEFGSGPGAQIWGHADDIGIGAVRQRARFHDGHAPEFSIHAFAGLLDEVRVYDSVLTDSEIQALASFSGQTANQAPTAQFVLSPSTAQAPANITFNASGSGDSDGSIVIYNWDFGDTTTGTGRLASHQFDAAGTYTIELEVSDDDGAKSTSTATLIVTSSAGNSAPVALFSATPITGSPRSIRFDASASTDSDGVLDQFVWDLGDGEAKIGQVVTHEYVNGGVYNVKLTVVDNLGATTVVQETIEVESAFPESLQPTSIGPIGSNGAVSYENEKWNLRVPGAKWDPRVDAVLFVHRPVNNDVEVIVRVDSIAVEDSLLSAGVGIRSNLTPTAANASVSVVGQDQVVYRYRATDGGWEVESASAAISLPLWVRISKKGDKVIGSYSVDGIIWNDLGEQSIPIQDGVFGGLSAHSIDENRIASATMSEFSVAIDDDVLIDVPNDYVLSNSFPNPFNESTQFTLSLSQQEDILVEAYDLAGRRIAVLQDGPMAPNTLHRIVFDGAMNAST